MAEQNATVYLNKVDDKTESTGAFNIYVTDAPMEDVTQSKGFKPKGSNITYVSGTRKDNVAQGLLYLIDQKTKQPIKKLPQKEKNIWKKMPQGTPLPGFSFTDREIVDQKTGEPIKNFFWVTNG